MSSDSFLPDSVDCQCELVGCRLVSLLVLAVSFCAGEMAVTAVTVTAVTVHQIMRFSGRRAVLGLSLHLVLQGFLIPRCGELEESVSTQNRAQQ